MGLPLRLLAVVVSGTALLFRRRTPMVSLAAAAVIMLITFSVPASFAAAATAMALFAVAVYRSQRDRAGDARHRLAGIGCDDFAGPWLGVQEGLTNALKYARTATAVTVHAHFSRQMTTISVTDDAEPGVVPADEPGRGVTGMRERVALYGGILDAGALAGAGWSVTARFPPQKGVPWQR